MKKSYKEAKEAAREEAIEIQRYISDIELSYGEMVEIQDHLERTGRRYGLIKEFRENGLI